MTARSRGPRRRAASGSPVRHPVAAHVGVALLAITLLTGVAVVAAHGASQTVENDAQGRVRSNRDAAVRALVRQCDRRALPGAA